MRIVVLDDYQDCVRGLAAATRLAAHEVAVYRYPAPDMETLIMRLASAEVLVLTRERTAITAALLARLPQLRMISTAGPLPKNLDLAACSERGIAVAQSQGTGAATAELCWALILASRRHLVDEVQSLRAGRWQSALGQQLQGHRLGIWGYGKVGRQVAQFGLAFGMRVWVWGRESSQAGALRDGVAVAPSRAEFIAESDVLSLHQRLTPETARSISAGELMSMKPDALFVNTARAELLAPDALWLALNAGRPGYAAIDVFENEPVMDTIHPLLRHPRVLATPHIGFVERDNYESFFGLAFDHILRFAAGETSHLVNPQAVCQTR